MAFDLKKLKNLDINDLKNLDLNDVKELIETLVEKIQKDPGLVKQFKTEPVKAIEKVLGVDLPDELLEKVVDGVKAGITLDKLDDAVDLLKKLF